MSRGSGAGGWRVLERQVTRPMSGQGEVGTTTKGFMVFGNEQQPQSWQFGAHWPPETSEGQSSEQASSPKTAASPLISNEMQSTAMTTRARSTAGNLTRRRRRRRAHGIRGCVPGYDDLRGPRTVRDVIDV